MIRAWEDPLAPLSWHSVIVECDGFVWQGQRFRSLSAVACAITGMQWNGYRFFSLERSPAIRGTRELIKASVNKDEGKD